jgi:A/G-specific adenine glycosylase
MPLQPVHREIKNQIRTRLLTWYRKNKRDLPWRKTRDPYRILVSEIMLQQTQVATVIPYYRRFIETFPTVASLAAAPLQKVLKLWEGLGYYSRARNLHRAARVIHERWNDRVPSAVEGLSSLPGIGRYTAGAVASIAFDLRAPVLDGNVRRVLCRIFAIRKDPRQALIQNRLWRLAEQILPDRSAGDFNQALMELGATVCLPQTPSCRLCPAGKFCGAFQKGIQDRIPFRPERRPIPDEEVAVILIRNGSGLLIGPRPEKGLLAGLWGFPEIDREKAKTPRSIAKQIEERLGLELTPIRPLEPVAHTFSHKRITYYPFLFQSLSKQDRLPGSWRWVPTVRIADYPLPNATRKIFDQIAIDVRRAQRAIGGAKPARAATMKSRRREPLPMAAEQPAVYRKTRS